MSNLPLSFDLKIGTKVAGGDPQTSVSLLEVNGVAEEVFLKRLPDRPYTWMGQVLSVGIDRIGNTVIGSPAREDYLKNANIAFAPEILSLPIAEVNTLLVEIHRRVWKHEIRNQECTCKYCGNTLFVDIDLNRLEYSAESLEKLGEKEDPFTVVVDLPRGWKFSAPKLGNGQGESPFVQYDGLVFDRFTFRVPTLAVAIKNEKQRDQVKFWRAVAYDCLVEVVCTDQDIVLPKEAYMMLGLKLYNQILTGPDLGAIREALRECLPVLPLAYEETCPHCSHNTPVIMEQTSFFGE